MSQDSKRLFHIAIGLVDYLKDLFDDLQQELLRRGEERGEEISDFWDDIVENLSFVRGGETSDADEGRNYSGEEPEGLGGLLTDLNLKDLLQDIVQEIGLATEDDLSEISEKLERLGRAIENMTE